MLRVKISIIAAIIRAAFEPFSEPKVQQFDLLSPLAHLPFPCEWLVKLPGPTSDMTRLKATQ